MEGPFSCGGQNLLAERVALLLDGGFVKKKLQDQLKRFPKTADVVGFCRVLMSKPRLADRDLFRVFYYDAPPYEGHSANPIDGSVLNFSATTQANQNRALLDALELEPDFAVRRGTVIQTGWKLGSSALRSLSASQRPIAAGDLVPNMAQKGVDLRIGLDIAWISLKRLVEVLVLVTGDSDFVPAMKFARREGIKVYLDAMGHAVRRELKAHADFVL
jgi:uncharacterized LabA/DUF88 family protein